MWLQKLSLGYGHREGFLDLQENDGDYNDMDNKDDVIDKDWEDKSVPLLPAMKELRVTGRNMDDLYPPSWSRFLGRCDHLRALLVSSIDQGWVQALAECRTLERLTLIKAKTGNLRLLTTALRTGLPSLSALCVTDNNSPDEEMAFVLSACRAGWRSIELPIIGSRSVDALIEHHCPTLEILKVSRARDMSSTQMIQILASSPRLHTFVTFDEEVIPNPDVPHFVADDFIDLDHSTGQLRPWLCESTLKEFRAYVTGIPRPDLNKTFHGHPLDKDMVMQESFPGQGPELQRLVYERLARFSRLERLQLGHDDRLISVMYMLMYSDADIEGWDDESHQYNCLEMSLASGLRALEGLKELKELKVSRMATAVGIDDVQWMVQSWPRLKTLSGLNYSAEAEVQAASWLKETCPSIALRMCQKRGK
ncbi:hypothetical protein BGW39_001614 [Mortierella sp. 14UC]|nr:hypothetical protein BGW39_001614 [Mortierella sp. 14UC]